MNLTDRCRYAPGTHNIRPVEMDSSLGIAGQPMAEKHGVERYS